MARDLGRLEIDKLIVHDVPSRRVNTSGPSPTLSEIESPLTTTVRNYIRDKVVGTLTNNSFPVVFDSSSGSPVPSLVMDNLGNQMKPFVDTSQELANHLFQTQKGSNPPGLLVVTCPPRTGPGVMLVLGLKERGVKMARRKHTAEQIINKLREAEVAISAGSTVAEVSRQIGVTQQTFYRWRTEYGGLKIDQARRLKQLETENGRLRRAVADLTLDNQILREAAEGNF